MKLLVKYGADPEHPDHANGRAASRTGDVDARRAGRVAAARRSRSADLAMPPLLAASGQGYGEGFAANHHQLRARPACSPAVKYLVEELHVDVNAHDHDGNTAIHNAAARGDNEMILYLVSKGADVRRSSTAKARRRWTWPTVRSSASARSPTRSSCSRAWA